MEYVINMLSGVCAGMLSGVCDTYLDEYSNYEYSMNTRIMNTV